MPLPSPKLEIPDVYGMIDTHTALPSPQYFVPPEIENTCTTNLCHGNVALSSADEGFPCRRVSTSSGMCPSDTGAGAGAGPANNQDSDTQSDAGSEFSSSKAPDHLCPQMNDFLRNLPALDLLNSDPRPTFVLDLLADNNKNYSRSTLLNIIYANFALRQDPNLLNGLMSSNGIGHSLAIINPGGNVTTLLGDPAFYRFKRWALQMPQPNVTSTPTNKPFIYRGIAWSAALVSGRFRVLSGLAQGNGVILDTKHTVLPSARLSVPTPIEPLPTDPKYLPAIEKRGPPRRVSDELMVKMFDQVNAHEPEDSLDSESEWVIPDVVHENQPREQSEQTKQPQATSSQNHERDSNENFEADEARDTFRRITRDETWRYQSFISRLGPAMDESKNRAWKLCQWQALDREGHDMASTILESMDKWTDYGPATVFYPSKEAWKADMHKKHKATLARRKRMREEERRWEEEEDEKKEQAESESESESEFERESESETKSVDTKPTANEDIFFPAPNKNSETVETCCAYDQKPIFHPVSHTPNPPSFPSVISESRDWTRVPITPETPEFIRQVRAVNWAATPFGPIEYWSSTQRTMTNLVMSSAHAALLWWGPEHAVLYNEAYSRFVTDMHPRLLGACFSDIKGDRFRAIEPFLRAAYVNGQGTMKTEDMVRVQRNGRIEEIFITWSMTPVLDGFGKVQAVHAGVYDTTDATLKRLRESSLRSVVEETRTATSMGSFWTAVMHGLESARDDIPFALAYSLKSQSSMSRSSISATSPLEELSFPKYPSRIVLEGTRGVPENHQLAVDKINLDGASSSSGLAPYLRQAMAHQDMLVLSTHDQSLSAGLLDGLPGATDKLVVFPVELTGSVEPSDAETRTTLGFLVLGINARRPLTKDYTQFFHVLCTQLRRSASQLMHVETRLRQGLEEAHKLAQDHDELVRRVSYLKKVSHERENKFSRMAEFLPVGLFTADFAGSIVFCNNKWSQISRHDKSATSRLVWFDIVCDEDRAGVEEMWKKLLVSTEVQTHEFRLKTPASPAAVSSPDPTASPPDTTTPPVTWLLLNAFPLHKTSATDAAVFGCLTDITAQKAAEAFQARERAMALEEKHRQARFIDMTSHELRNPLGVVMQSADEISSGVAALRSDSAATKAERARLLASFASAAETISLCVNHQASILDDVLMLSKMDANLLHVTPVPTRAEAVLREVLRMHESQLLAAGIQLTCRIDPSVEAAGLKDWAMLDPTRLKQVLINFLTNAIKFTRDQPRKVITVTIAAAYDDTCANATVDPNTSVPTLSNSPLLTASSLLPPHCSNISQFPMDTTPQPDVAVAAPASDTGSSMPPTPAISPSSETGPCAWGSGRTVNLVFAISDTGPGLSAKTRTRLFRRFRQASPRTHVTYGGSGLGLFISRNLVEMQGGRVGVASEEGVGTTFTFYIKTRLSAAPAVPVRTHSPFKPSTLHNNTNMTDAAGSRISHKTIAQNNTDVISSLGGASPATSLPDPATAATAVPPKHIMYVEDNTINATLAKRQLEKLGSCVTIAKHGAEALEKLRESRFWTANAGAGFHIDVILMDLEMPVMDGKECVQHIRALEADGQLTQRLPVIAVTAYTRQAVADEVKGLGMDGIIAKPFRMAKLIAQVNALLAQSAPARSTDTEFPRLPVTAAPAAHSSQRPQRSKHKRHSSMMDPTITFPSSSTDQQQRPHQQRQQQRRPVPIHMPSTPNLSATVAASSSAEPSTSIISETEAATENADT